VFFDRQKYWRPEIGFYFWIYTIATFDSPFDTIREEIRRNV
jgi:hypothetical protein